MSKKIYVGVGNKARRVTDIYIGVGNIARRIKRAYIGIGGVARPIYNDSGDLSYYGRITDLPVVSSRNIGVSIGDYALFGGGGTDAGVSSRSVYTYSTSLTLGSATNLTSGRADLAASSDGIHALFGGGYGQAYVDAYTTSLTHSVPSQLSKARGYLASTVVGQYFLFGGGGSDLSDNSDVVDSYSSS